MIKALFRKQMLEVFSWFYKDKRTGKFRSVKGAVGYALLYLVLFGLLAVVFGYVADALCEPLLHVGMGWLYWCLMGLIAIFLGVFGSVFNTYSSLYRAKDNDLLLSMPIPMFHILLTRLSGVYAMGLMYELLVMLPAVIVWLIMAPLTFFGTVHVLLIPLVLSLLILVLSAAFGWVVAAVMARVKRRSMLTVVLSLAFIAAYYYLYGNAYTMLTSILENAEQFGAKARVVLYPLYHMGLAAEGSVLSMLIFTAIAGALLAAVIFVLAGSFLRLATANRGMGKTVYRARSAKAGSLRGALLRRELRRFTGSATYMLNCGLGILLMPIGSVLLLWKADAIRSIFPLLSSDTLALSAIGAVCAMTAMNDMTSCVISLEGKSLWIVQSFPVSGRQVLEAKLRMHLLLTLIPAIIPILAVEWLIQPELFYAIALPVIIVLFVLLMAALGLLCNLKMPHLNWSSEVIPVKQSAPPMIALLGGWGLVAILGGGYYLLAPYIGAGVFTVCAAVLLAAADGILLRWLMTRGARIFSDLQ